MSKLTLETQQAMTRLNVALGSGKDIENCIDALEQNIATLPGVYSWRMERKIQTVMAMHERRLPNPCKFLALAHAIGQGTVGMGLNCLKYIPDWR